MLLVVFLFVCFVCILVVTQGSSLLMSMALIPLTLLVVTSMKTVEGGLFSLFVMLMFVGGLLILLVGVSSLVAPEHSLLMFGGSLFSIISTSVWVSHEGSLFSIISTSVWVSHEGSFVTLVGATLVIGLFILSSMFMENKFCMRSECFVGVKARFLFEE